MVTHQLRRLALAQGCLQTAAFPPREAPPQPAHEPPREAPDATGNDPKPN